MVKKFLSYFSLFFLSFIWVIPFYSSIIAALKTNEEFALSPFWNLPKDPINAFLENLRMAWEIGNLSYYFTNSLLYASIGAASAVLIASLGAFSLARLKFKGRDGLFFLIMLGTFFPFQMYLIPLLRLWLNLGLYNTFIGLLIVYIAITIPFLIFLLRNYFITIPQDLFDAARIDGLSYFKIYLHIFLPLSLPALVVGFTIQFVWIWNDLLFGMVLTSSVNTRNVMAGLTTISGSFSYTYATLSAAALIAALPPMLVFIFLQRFVVRGLLLGSLKR